MCDNNCICEKCIAQARKELEEIHAKNISRLTSARDKRSVTWAKQLKEMSELGIPMNEGWM